MPRASEKCLNLNLSLDENGHLWAQSDGLRAVRHESFHFAELMRTWRSAEAIWVAASPQNARLLCFLSEELASERANFKLNLSPPIENVGQPWLLDYKSRSVPPSRGGGRRFIYSDYLVYAIIRSGEHKDTTTALRLARQHPAWPALSFPRAYDEKYAAMLISAIMDPRWYIDPLKPDCSKRLCSRFGLGREGLYNAQFLRKDRAAAGRNIAATRLVLSTWYGGRSTNGTLSEVVPDDPFYSIYAQTPDPSLGLLNASKAFLRFVCEVWLDNLTSPRSYCHRDDGAPKLKPAKEYSPQLFVPEYLFKDRKTQRRWAQHLEEWRARCHD